MYQRGKVIQDLVLISLKGLGINTLLFCVFALTDTVVTHGQGQTGITDKFEYMHNKLILTVNINSGEVDHHILVGQATSGDVQTTEELLGRRVVIMVQVIPLVEKLVRLYHTAT
jgi:hypothetical protein